METYLTSGLLPRFQGQPQAGHPNSSSLGIQQGLVDKLEEENTSECSQGSNAVNCAQFSHLTETAALNATEDFRTEESTSRGGHNLKQYSTYEDITTGINETQFSSHELPGMQYLDTSLESLGQFGTSGFFLPLHENHDAGTALLQCSNGYMTPSTAENMIVGPESNSCEITFSEATITEYFPEQNATNESNDMDLDGDISSLLSRVDLRSTSPARTLSLKSSVHQKDVSNPTLELEVVRNLKDDFIFVDSPNGDADKTGHRLKLGEAQNAPKLVPVDIFSSSNSDSKGTFQDKRDKELDEAEVPLELDTENNTDCSQTLTSMDDSAVMHNEEHDLGTLSYEPPRFPVLDIPFFSCDLMTSGVDIQQTYSPLGIRQLMMSPTNFSSPRCLLDSPVLDGTPEGILKQAFKSFTSTPFILKKRPNEVLSPAEKTKGEINLERDTNMRTSGNAGGFSSLDSVFHENGSCTESLSATDKSFQSHHHKKVRYENSLREMNKMDCAFEERKEIVENLDGCISEKGAEAKVDAVTLSNLWILYLYTIWPV